MWQGSLATRFRILKRSDAHRARVRTQLAVTVIRGRDWVLFGNFPHPRRRWCILTYPAVDIANRRLGEAGPCQPCHKAVMNGCRRFGLDSRRRSKARLAGLRFVSQIAATVIRARNELQFDLQDQDWTRGARRNSANQARSARSRVRFHSRIQDRCPEVHRQSRS